MNRYDMALAVGVGALALLPVAAREPLAARIAHSGIRASTVTVRPYTAERGRSISRLCSTHTPSNPISSFCTAA